MDKKFDVVPYINTIKMNTFSVMASGRREAAKKAHEELTVDFPGLNVVIDRISREKIIISGTNEHGDIVLFAHIYQRLDEEQERNYYSGAVNELSGIKYIITVVWEERA